MLRILLGIVYFHIIYLFFLPLVAYFVQAQKQDELLLSGPMAAATGPDSTIIWLQTLRPAYVQIRYRLPGSENFYQTPETKTRYDHLAKISLKNLIPDKEYQYELLLNGRLTPLTHNCKFKTAPVSLRNIRFTAGSCNFIWGKEFSPKDSFVRPYRLNTPLYSSLNREAADFMLWLGDNVYLSGDEMYRADGIRHRYKYCRSLENMQPFLGNTSHFAVWDDHDYGNNDAEADFPLKDTSVKVFKDYFPPVHDPSVKFKGISSKMQWGDIQFFLLDDRYYRKSKSKNKFDKSFEPTLLGKEQLAWLKQELKSSTAPFKALVMGSQTFNFTHVGESVLEDFENETIDLFRFIRNEKISGVFIISGDRHYAEVNRYLPPGGYPIVEYCVSPMLSPPAFFLTWRPTPTRLMSYNKRNYALFEISGKAAAERVLHFYVKNHEGKTVLQHQLPLSELQFLK